MEFLLLFEDYLKALNSLTRMDVEKLKPTLKKVCDYLRVAKISTLTYGNSKFEAMDRGEELISYDNGQKCVQAVSKRIVTDLMTVIKCNVYIAEGEEPWTPEEIDRIRLVIETTSVYFSRSNIQAVAEKFAFYDDDGYHNLRYYIRHIERTAQNGSFQGKAALHFKVWTAF